MTPAKRIFDIVVSAVLLVIFGPLLAVVAVLLLIFEGRPLFYISERMRDVDTSFQLIKFRTMSVTTADGGVTGGDKSGRISRAHRLLRRTRLDEVPQLWNVLRGDMSLVGPRPPLRLYSEGFRDLYAQVLRRRPGITGLASLEFHRREEALLAGCKTPEETDAVYRRRCIPRKARLDLIYQRHASLCFDLAQRPAFIKGYAVPKDVGPIPLG